MKYKVGIDIGSTTAKVVVLNENNRIVFSRYKRHLTRVNETLITVFYDLQKQIGNKECRICITGSVGIGLAERFKTPFIQEVVACSDYIQKKHSDIKTLIDIGGEDSKMILFSKKCLPDIRMNGVCAGGTGAFIDQMANLLNLSVKDLNKYAENYKNIYPISSRCGVFAKTDIQNLLSRKISKEDIVMSVFDAVALQALNTLSRAQKIEGKIIFSGGPFSFFPALRKRFLEQLSLKEEEVEQIDSPELLPALGAAFYNSQKKIFIQEFINELNDNLNEKIQKKSKTFPLFNSKAEYQEWKKNKVTHHVKFTEIKKYNGKNCYLGIDSGSTTTKIVILGDNKEILFHYYISNKGNPIGAVKEGLLLFENELKQLNKDLKIFGSVVTGYGEDLIKAAFDLDKGVVETIAHFRGAKEISSELSFILDIGGQDMKAIFIENNCINRIELNESCSSGCGSFIETFSHSLGYNISEFSELGCLAKSPYDLGVRCTVFMNSKVKQAVRENTSVEDIAAGLSFSVVKNALYKVLQMRNLNLLGDSIVVQGGTFKNESVHRAFEKLLGKKVYISNIPELMGAYGAALIALEEGKTFLDIKNIEEYSSDLLQCKGCENQCTVTKFQFENDNLFFSGNKCEKFFHNKGLNFKKGYNFFEEKLKLLFDRSTTVIGKYKGRIGIPRVFNMYENYPFWNMFFRYIGYEVVLSSPSSHKIYKRGKGTVMSDNICFPAKIVHGHVLELIENKVDRIFYPMIIYEKDNLKEEHNTFNCPIVTGYPEVIASSINPEKNYNIPFDYPAFNMRDSGLFKKALWNYVKKLGIKKRVFENAFDEAVLSESEYKFLLKEKASVIIEKSIKNKSLLIILSGKPYHADSYINHKIPEIISSYGVDVISEDAVPLVEENILDLPVISQWAYSNRSYALAKWVTKQGKNIQMVQINSFNCGPDAIVVDEVYEILKEVNKPYTILKIDDINSGGSIKLRIRSLIESLKIYSSFKKRVERVENTIIEKGKHRVYLTPILSDIYLQLFPTLLNIVGCKIELLPMPDDSCIQLAEKYCNHDICYPAKAIVGVALQALMSGKYDLDKVAVGHAQTCGQCRASNYVGTIKKALIAAGYSNVPVGAIGTVGKTINEQPGFDYDLSKITVISFISIIYVDNLTRMYYSTVSKEVESGISRKILNKYLDKVKPFVAVEDINSIYKLLKKAVVEFNSIDVKPIYCPKVGIIGEIYVKYNSFGNLYSLDFLIQQGIEVVLTPLSSFFTQEIVNYYTNKKLSLSRTNIKADLMVYFFEHLSKKYLRKAEKIMKKYIRYTSDHSVKVMSKKAKELVSLAHQYGEGWLITGEIISFQSEGINNIISLQPFGCIANQVVSRGIEKKLKDRYPNLNLLFLDFDGGISEVNIINRLLFFVDLIKKS